MLTIWGRPQKNTLCDGLSRRSFLRIGGCVMGGMTLPQLLRAEQTKGQRAPHKAVIMIFLPGGPPHQDMFDLKPDMPAEIRGEFQPIKTNVAGIEISEQFPRLATMMDKFAIVRSIVGATGDHYAFQCHTGRPHQRQPQGGWPSLGSSLSKLLGPGDSSVPGFVGLAPKMGHMPWADNGQSGYLGISHAPFKPMGEGRGDMTLNGISLERLSDRRALLGSFDRFRSDIDSSGMMTGMDSFNQQALGVLTSSRLAEALDISKEDPATIERYGRGDPNNRDDGGPKLMEQMLMARRLVEAGVRCVTLAFSRWDWHGKTFEAGRQDMPMLDQGITALVADLHARGLDKDVSVVVWGEFGRTPKINKNNSRDHWPQANACIVAGGGMRHGQVIGATNKYGEEPVDRPVKFQEVFATLYHNLGLDAHRDRLFDGSGTPRYPTDSDVEPIRELL